MLRVAPTAQVKRLVRRFNLESQPLSARDMPAPGRVKTIKSESTTNSRACQASKSVSSKLFSSFIASSPARRNFHPLSLIASTSPCCARRTSNAMDRPV